jgi:hypothetical protein
MLGRDATVLTHHRRLPVQERIQQIAIQKNKNGRFEALFPPDENQMRRDMKVTHIILELRCASRGPSQTLSRGNLLHCALDVVHERHVGTWLGLKCAKCVCLSEVCLSSTAYSGERAAGTSVGINANSRCKLRRNSSIPSTQKLSEI